MFWRALFIIHFLTYEISGFPTPLEVFLEGHFAKDLLGNFSFSFELSNLEK